MSISSSSPQPGAPAFVAAPDSDDDPEVARVLVELQRRMCEGAPKTASRVGRYMVLERIGAGAMGVVYSAIDDTLDRKVALKLLRVELDTPALRDRLLREARSMAMLSSPCVATVYEAGDHGGRLFVAMEFIRGRTLRQWCASERPGWRAIVGAFVHAAQGLAAAHAAGLVHRDFKPDNAMIDDLGRVKVLDFGLARGNAAVPDRTLDDGPPRVGGEALDATPLTRTGALIGTPVYMAPELLGGAEADARSDQFAFCVALYEALWGVRPFAGKTAIELRDAMMSGVLARAAGDDDVPAWIRRVVVRGLAADPAARWPSMEALAAALQRDPSRWRRRVVAGVGLAVAAIAVWSWQRFEHARAIAGCEASGAEIAAVWDAARAATVTEAFAATGLGYAEDSVARVLPWLDRQTERWRAARTEACVAAGVEHRWSDDTLARATWCLDDRRVELASFVDELEAADATTVMRAVSRAAALAPVEPCLDETLLARLPVPPSDRREVARASREQLGGLAWRARTGSRAHAITLVEDATSAARAVEWPPLVARAETIHAAVLEAAASYDAAVEIGSAAYFDAAKVGAWDVAADAAIALVAVLGDRLAQHDAAMQWSRHAALAIEHAGDPASLRRAALLEAVGRTHFNAGRFAEAATTIAEAAALHEQALGADHPAMASSLIAQAILAGASGDLPRARAIAERAVPLIEAAYGPDHPTLATALQTLGNVYAQSGEYDLAETTFVRAVEISERSLGPWHPDVGQTLSNLAFLYYTTGHSDQAEPLLERALAIRERALGPDHPDLGSTLNSLASVYAERGEHTRARELYLRALANAEAARGADHPEVAQTLTNLAAVLYASGDREGGVLHYERALGVFERALGPDHPEVAASLATLAQANVEMDAWPQALPRFERAIAIYDSTPGEQEGEDEARFAFARALLTHGGDRARACGLARAARDHYRASGERMAAPLAEVDAWMIAPGVACDP